MKKLVTTIFAAVLAFGLATVVIPAPEAQAAGAINGLNHAKAACPNCQVYTVPEGDNTVLLDQIGRALNNAITNKAPGINPGQPIILYFVGGTHTVTSPKGNLGMRSGLYLAADASTVVNVNAKHFLDQKGGGAQSGFGVFGGTWNGSSKSEEVFVVNNMSNVKFHGVTIQNSGQQGLLITKSTNVKVSNSIVRNNNSTGILVTAGSKDVLVEKSILSGNGKKPKKTPEGEQGHGIGIFKKSVVTITGSKILDNKVCGVSPFDATAIVKKTTITNNGRHGIGARKNVTLTVVDSTVSNNKYHGIMVDDKSKATIEGGKVENNAEDGISIDHKSSLNVVKKAPIVKGNKKRQVDAQNAANNSKITGVKIK